MTAIRQTRGGSAWLFASLPWAWLMLMAVFVTAVSITSGSFPTYGQPDPKHAGAVSTLYLPVMILWMIALASPAFAALYATDAAVRRQPLTPLLRPAALHALGWALMVTLFAADVFGLGNWLLD